MIGGCGSQTISPFSFETNGRKWKRKSFVTAGETWLVVQNSFQRFEHTASPLYPFPLSLSLKEFTTNRRSRILLGKRKGKGTLEAWWAEWWPNFAASKLIPSKVEVITAIISLITVLWLPRIRAYLKLMNQKPGCGNQPRSLFVNHHGKSASWYHFFYFAG